MTFGPMPRDYSYSLPAVMKRRAVLESVMDKAVSSKLFILDKLEVEAPKTKLVAAIVKKFKFVKPLLLVSKKSENLVLASRNIQGVSLKTADEVNALDMVSSKECAMTKDAYTDLLKRLK